MHAWPLEMSSNDEQRDRRWIGEEEEKEVEEEEVEERERRGEKTLLTA